MPKDRLSRLQAEDRGKGMTLMAITQLKVHFTQCERASEQPPPPPCL
jgi:hypothetical protein